MTKKLPPKNVLRAVALSPYLAAVLVVVASVCHHAIAESGRIASATGTPVAPVAGKVVYIVDGDTLDVEIEASVRLPGEHGELTGSGPVVIRIRLLADESGRGCWAPESRTLNLAEKRRGLAAKANLTKLALGKPCVVDFRLVSRRLIDYLSLERALAPVRVGGRSLGQQQIDAKLASSTKGGRLGT